MCQARQSAENVEEIQNCVHLHEGLGNPAGELEAYRDHVLCLPDLHEHDFGVYRATHSQGRKAENLLDVAQGIHCGHPGMHSLSA
jgi:hypothetical protein